jgi:hypothetical protein
MPPTIHNDPPEGPPGPEPPDGGDPGRRGLADLLELCRVLKLIDRYELRPGTVVFVQRGLRYELQDRQARTFIAGALNYTTWSYMTAYPLQKGGAPNVSLPEARRLMQVEHRVRAQA